MTIFVTLAIFSIILFCYIYIMHQYKLSEDLEMYEMDYVNNVHLQDVCDIRQPVIFLIRIVCKPLFDDFSPTVLLRKYSSYDLQIKNMNDYFIEPCSKDLGTVPLPLQQTIPLICQDTTAKFVSETNGDFLEETGLLGHLGRIMDPLLKPAFTIHTSYDMLFGANGTITPFKYHTYYRRFLCVTSGKIRLRMSSWKHTKHMHPIKDYEHYEFRSPVHPTSPSSKYIHDFERMNFLEFEVDTGYVVYIPAYWWYSIEYISANSVASACSVSYTSVMNMVANIPDITLYWLQQQNITNKVGKMRDDPVQDKKEDVPEKEIETKEPLNQASCETVDQDIAREVEPTTNIV